MIENSHSMTLVRFDVLCVAYLCMGLATASRVPETVSYVNDIAHDAGEKFTEETHLTMPTVATTPNTIAISTPINTAVPTTDITTNTSTLDDVTSGITTPTTITTVTSLATSTSSGRCSGVAQCLTE